MRSQQTIRVIITMGELDFLSALDQKVERFMKENSALICRLRRAYEKACEAADVEPNAELLNESAAYRFGSDDQERFFDTLQDISDAVRAAKKKGIDEMEESTRTWNESGQTMQSTVV